MKFKEIMTELGDKHSKKDIDKAIKKITPSQFRKAMKRKEDGVETNVLIKLIKKKLKSS